MTRKVRRQMISAPQVNRRFLSMVGAMRVQPTATIPTFLRVIEHLTTSIPTTLRAKVRTWLTRRATATTRRIAQPRTTRSLSLSGRSEWSQWCTRPTVRRSIWRCPQHLGSVMLMTNSLFNGCTPMFHSGRHLKKASPRANRASILMDLMQLQCTTFALVFCSVAPLLKLWDLLHHRCWSMDLHCSTLRPRLIFNLFLHRLLQLRSHG
mmetsp:Transcript_23607/g.58591  ORF Transcript_23607/g.58591 Transcript_23607/m.58591 type:complete len:208 (-) Transcript_23607:593-1216(-)